MPLVSLLPNTIWCLEQISRESSEDIIVYRDSRYKWVCMGTSDKVMI